jgi:hypothetical protein
MYSPFASLMLNSFRITLLNLHVGTPAAALKNMSTVPISAFADAVKEYEDNLETDNKGDMMYA